MDINRLDPETTKKQEIIYRFFSEITHQYPPKEVLKEFKGLFFDYYSFIENQEAITAIYDLTFGRYEVAFSSTLKKCCYILIKAWVEKQEYFCINELIKSFLFIKKKTTIVNTMMNRRDTWLENFVNSETYREFQYFIYHEPNSSKIWLPFYNYYGLMAQSLNHNNLWEQREAAQILAINIKNDFKFQLGRYIGDVDANLSPEMRGENPTHLGEQVVLLMKTLVRKRDKLNYSNLASLFLLQTNGLTYGKFKNSFHSYLMYSLEKNDIINTFRQQSFIAINSLEKDEDNEIINNVLITKLSQSFIDILTTNNTAEPSDLFKLFVPKVSPLILAIIFLKIILISPKSRETLDKNMAKLIIYYQEKKDQDCKWFINFLDVYNVAVTIYAEMDVKVYLQENQLIYVTA